jgi:glutamyl-tRNA synthetase
VAESDDRAANGESHVIRLKSNERYSFVDIVYGRYAKNEDEDDFILIKADGFPTYHFANVVDDHLMGITHVIRGAVSATYFLSTPHLSKCFQEWLISTPKHISLYKAFGWKSPRFAHVALLADSKGEKLSKRNNSADLSWYKDRLIVPSALNNWLALLGCRLRQKDNSETFLTMEDLIKNVSITLANTPTADPGG